MDRLLLGVDRFCAVAQPWAVAGFERSQFLSSPPVFLFGRTCWFLTVRRSFPFSPFLTFSGWHRLGPGSTFSILSPRLLFSARRQVDKGNIPLSLVPGAFFHWRWPPPEFDPPHIPVGAPFFILGGIYGSPPGTFPTISAFQRPFSLLFTACWFVQVRRQRPSFLPKPFQHIDGLPFSHIFLSP